MARLDYSGFRTRPKPAKRRSGWQGSMRLGALFAVLVGVNVYVFFFRGGTSIRDVLKSGAIAKRPAAAATSSSGSGDPAAQPGAPSNDDSVVVKGSLAGHLGLLGALSAVNIDRTQANEVIAALRPALDLRALRPKQSFEVRLDPATKRVRTFIYRVSQISSVVVTRNAAGVLKATRKEVELDTKVVKVGGRITSSLDGAVTGAGESSALVSMFVDLFGWDINWYVDPREGDEFRIVVEKQYNGDRFYRYGRILAAEYRGNAGRFQAFYHKPEGGKAGYYTPEGRSVYREFLKMPLNFRRISSTFSHRRFHPVLHQTRGHFGVDYAAPRGTPVWAVADGTVARVGRSAGAGNMVVLGHARGRATVYMHLSRFAAGLKRGSKVKQRQVIGYVGSTGLSTGPHLHYGITVNGRHVDPLRFGVGKGAMLPRKQRIRFMDELPPRMAALEEIPVADRGGS